MTSKVSPESDAGQETPIKDFDASSKEQTNEPPEALGMLLAEAAGIAKLEIAIPASVYGAAAIMPVLHETPTWGVWLQVVGRQLICLILNLSIQVFYLYCIPVIWDAEVDAILDGDCEDSELSPWLTVVCIPVFAMFIIVDLEETLFMAELFLHLIPSVKGESQDFRYVKDENDELKLNSGGFGVEWKVMIFFFVILPKFVIAILLLIYGSLYLGASGSDTDLLLNTLALLFILDIDEVIYSLLTPSYCKRLVEAVPPFAVEAAPWYWRLWYSYGFAAKIFAICGCFAITTQTPMCGYMDGVGGGYKKPTGSD